MSILFSGAPLFNKQNKIVKDDVNLNTWEI